MENQYQDGATAMAIYIVNIVQMISLQLCYINGHMATSSFITNLRRQVIVDMSHIKIV
jgi:hypothetical protein